MVGPIEGRSDELSGHERDLLELARNEGPNAAVNAALIEVLMTQHHAVARKLDRLLWAVIATLGAIVGDLLGGLA